LMRLISLLQSLTFWQYFSQNTAYPKFSNEVKHGSQQYWINLQQFMFICLIHVRTILINIWFGCLEMGVHLQ
jgi:hypothetical protein